MSAGIKKPSTQRGKRWLDQRAPKQGENTKRACFVKGGNTSSQVNECLKDLYLLKKPDALLMKRNNPFHPFEDTSGLEKFSYKFDSSLFVFGSHSKKRPHNLIMGRMYDYHLLDMVEFGIEKFIPKQQFQCAKCTLGSKPLILFAGESFLIDPLHLRLKSLLIDFFQGQQVENIRLQGLEHVLSFTAEGQNRIRFRSYRILFKKSGGRTPRVELTEMGPRFDMSIRRSRLASDDMFKLACKQPRQLKPKKRKNIAQDVFGTQLGRVHMGNQDLSKLQTRKLKALKRTAGSKKRKLDGDEGNQAPEMSIQ